MQPGAVEFRRVVETHQSMVYSIALRITCDAGVAEEVAQDTFLALYRGGEAVSGEEHTRHWLRRVATHGAIDALRRQGRQPESAAEEWLEEEHGAGAAGREQFGLEARLEDLLRSLPEVLRVAVVLRYCEEMSPGEIGQMLGHPVATVKSHLQRGLSLLRRKAAVQLKEYVRD